MNIDEHRVSNSGTHKLTKVVPVALVHLLSLVALLLHHHHHHLLSLVVLLLLLLLHHQELGRLLFA